MTHEERKKEISDFGVEFGKLFSSQLLGGDELRFSNVVDGAVLALLFMAANCANEGKKGEMVERVSERFDQHRARIMNEIATGVLSS